jgi:hypothetical protein
MDKFRNSPQCLHFRASFWISSAQNGHFFIIISLSRTVQESRNVFWSRTRMYTIYIWSWILPLSIYSEIVIPNPASTEHSCCSTFALCGQACSLPKACHGGFRSNSMDRRMIIGFFFEVAEEIERSDQLRECRYISIQRLHLSVNDTI